VALVPIGRLVRVAVLFLLGDEGPLLVELHLTGSRGKKPRPRRGPAWRAGRPPPPVAPPCPCSPPPADWFVVPHSSPGGAARPTGPCLRGVCSGTGQCLCVRRSGAGRCDRPRRGVPCWGRCGSPRADCRGR